jgi:hypothetical protein
MRTRTALTPKNVSIVTFNIPYNLYIVNVKT